MTDKPIHAQCYDCGLDYTSPRWIEMVVSDDIWEKINPSQYKGAGLLCASCIVKRLNALGIKDVEYKIYHENLRLPNDETA